jgi:SAM-dependent methyltransferase
MNEHSIPPEPSEFDVYADDYAKLIADPLRDRFAADPIYFHERKLDVLCRFLRSRSFAPAKLRWIDIGCGRGDLLRLGRGKFGSVCGCDVSKESLRYCREFPVALQDGQSLPFDDAEFDVATAACVYHHVIPEQRLDLTRSALRVLKPGGIFCVFEHNPLNPVTLAVVRRSPVDVNAILLYARETVSLLRDAGFDVDATRYFLFVPAFAKALSGLEGVLSGIPFGGQYAVFGRRPAK